MTGFEEVVASELTWLLRAGASSRALRLSVRELVDARIERGPLGAHEIHDAVEAAMRAACRLVRESGAPAELVDIVCGAALEAVRGHGGESARWLPEATSTARAVLVEVREEGGDVSAWSWIDRRWR